MIQKYQKVSPRRFNRIFPALAPCECHTEDFNTLYDVSVNFDDTKHLTQAVKVTCSICGASATFDVRRYKIALKDVANGFSARSKNTTK